MDWRSVARAGALGAAMALSASAAALACSPVPGYVRPSNFELVQIADAIVVATPVAERPGGEDDFGRTVHFKVARTLKGEVASEIDVARLHVGRTRPSDPRSILFSHPEGHMGPCNRMTLAKGTAYILFLQKQGEGYAPLGYPFSRVNEDYGGKDALWTRAIQTYLRLQVSEPSMAQIATLEAMRNEILAKPVRTPPDAALAADIGMHLSSLSPWKPTAFLLAALDDLKAGRPPRYAARDPLFDSELSDAAAFSGLILSQLELKPSASPAEPQRDPREIRLLEMLVDDDHPAAMPLFEPLAAPDAPAYDLALALRFYAKNGRYRDAYRLIETRAAPLIETLPEDQAWILVNAIEEAQQDSEYHNGPRRWRGEADIAARWPRLALRLTQTMETRFGRSPDFASLTSLLGSDYRAAPDLTLLMSGRSKAITDWAARELVKPEVLAASNGGVDDPLRLPMRIVLRWMGLSHGDEDVAALSPALCQGSVQRRMLFEEWGRLGSSNGAREFLRLAAAPVVDNADLRVMAEAIAAWDSRYAAERGESWLATDAAMRKLAQGQALSPKDIKPLKPATCLD